MQTSRERHKSARRSKPRKANVLTSVKDFLSNKFSISQYRKNKGDPLDLKAFLLSFSPETSKKSHGSENNLLGSNNNFNPNKYVTIGMGRTFRLVYHFVKFWIFWHSA